jgi:HK97 family phage portal protein
MNMIQRALRWLEVRSSPANPDKWLLDLGQKEASAGVSVTEFTALECATVYACIRVLAESVAALPLHLYRRLDRGKERATDHPLYPLLHDLPNPELTSLELRELLMGHVLGWGNAYAEIEYNGAGRIIGLWPLRPDRTSLTRIDRRLRYKTRLESGQEFILPAGRVMHIRGLGFDGLVGYSPITMHREAIGLALATEEFGARFFGNGARPGSVLEHPGKLSDQALGHMKTSWEERHQGLEHSHRVAILEEGMKLHEVGIPPEDAQFLQTRQFQTVEICRIYRIPPHMVGDLSRATFSNIEEQAIEFVSHSLRPWLVRWEQAIYRDLLTPAERQTYFAEHLMDALLRGNTLSRYQAYAVGRANGWLSADDIREAENMNPIPGDYGQIYLVPLNMIPADQVGDVAQPVEAGEPTNTRALEQHVAPGQGLCDGGHETRPVETRDKKTSRLVAQRIRLANSYRVPLEDAIGRVVKREVADVRRAAQSHFKKRDAYQFGQWLEDFYRDHPPVWVKALLPILLNYADQIGASIADELGGDPPDSLDIRAFIDRYMETMSGSASSSSLLQLKALLDEATNAGQDPLPLIEERLDGWEDTRAERESRHESRNMLGALTVAFLGYRQVGKMIWTGVGDDCPFCRELNGRIVGVSEVFLNANEEFKPEGAESPLSLRTSMSHPPAHSGCDCMILAA